MSDMRYAIMFLRLGFLASALFAVFWGVWHLSGHQVPSCTSLKFTENISWIFPISRWWDIPFAFLLVNIYAWIFRVFFKFSLKHDNIVVCLTCSFFIAGFTAVGLGAGLGAGLVAVLVIGPIAGLGAGLGVSLCAGLYFLVRTLSSSNFWKAIYNWLTARSIA